MLLVRNFTVALFVDRTNGQWIVRDPEGRFWIVPADEENAWEHRRPFELSEDSDLLPVPGHYKYLLSLPF